MTITYTLIQMVEKIAEKSDKARIITKARVTELIMSGGTCTKCIYEKVGTSFKEFDPVIFTSGGFGTDFAQNSLLATYRPDLLHLTMNGEHCTGDAIKVSETIGEKKNHRPRVGSGAFHRPGAARQPRCQDQVPRSRGAPRCLWSCLRRKSFRQ